MFLYKYEEHWFFIRRIRNVLMILSCMLEWTLSLFYQFTVVYESWCLKRIRHNTMQRLASRSSMGKVTWDSNNSNIKLWTVYLTDFTLTVKTRVQYFYNAVLLITLILYLIPSSFCVNKPLTFIFIFLCFNNIFIQLMI